MENRTIGDAVSEGFRQWKKENPDWQTYLENPPSFNDPARVRQRRQEIYERLADCPLMYLQRILHAARLPPHPNRGHWERFFIREGMTMAQHARGQYLPFHREMEQTLAHIFETMDKEFFDYKGADGLARVKNQVETWFDTHIRQPAAEAFRGPFCHYIKKGAGRRKMLITRHRADVGYGDVFFCRVTKTRLHP